MTLQQRTVDDSNNRQNYRVPTGNTRVARVQRRIVHTLTFGVLESLTRKPVVPPTCLSLRTVRIVPAGLAAHICAR